MSRPRPELLAPAGSFAAACAALQYGADAVYLGLARFSARADAANLSADELGRAVCHAHALQPHRRVYVTLNTLVRDDELAELLEALEAVDAAGADGVIVQDLAVHRLARRHFPRLRLHASTQLAVHNVEGARALAELGFSRVVLARELSLAEVAAVAARAPLEVEVFVHGALCYAYSGLCLFSSLQTGRSGNRGRCAYCCREPFQGAAHAAPAYAFSMRDLARLEHLRVLAASGVASLKIEGRMKSPLYVAAVTDLYRRKLDGTLTPEEERARVADLQTIFSRPWTDLYARGPQPPGAVIDAVAVGHRGARVGEVGGVRRDRAGTRWLRFASDRALERHDGLQVELPAGGRPYGFAIDVLRAAGATRPQVGTPPGATVEVALPPDAPAVPAGCAVFCASSQAVKRRFPVALPRSADCRASRPLAVRVSLGADGADLAAAPADAPADGVSLEICAALPPARQPGQTAEAVRRAFARLGDTRWSPGTLELSDPEGRFVAPAQLNAWRRELLARLDEATVGHAAQARAARLAAWPEPPAASPVPAEAVRWCVKVDLLAHEPAAFAGADECVLRLGAGACGDAALPARLAAWRGAAPAARLRLALPLIVRDGAEAAAVEAAVARLLAAGWRDWECADLAGLHLLRRLGVAPGSLTADWSLYSLNRAACAQLAELGVARSVSSPEAGADDLAARARVAEPALEALVFQHPPLFISETPPCLPDAAPPSNGPVTLVDRRGARFLNRAVDGRSVTVAERPFCLLAHLSALLAAGVSRVRVDFSWSPPGSAARWFSLRAAIPPPDAQDGNYGRGLQ